MTGDKLTPIAVFTYNRPSLAQKLLESLAQCNRFQECIVYVFCDGPKNEEVSSKVYASQNVVRNWASSHNAHVIVRSENLGVARSVVSGVSELCDRYGAVIVLEDDLVCGPSFLDYMLEGLERYRNVELIFQLSGHMFPVRHDPKPDAIILPYITSWGWATWQRAWQHLDMNMTGHEILHCDLGYRRRFDLAGSYSFSSIVDAQLHGDVDAWDIQWYWTVFQAGALAVHPRKSLVWNGGFDGSGIHCEKGSHLWQPPLDQFLLNQVSIPLVWPEVINVNTFALRRVQQLLRAQRASHIHRACSMGRMGIQRLAKLASIPGRST